MNHSIPRILTNLVLVCLFVHGQNLYGQSEIRKWHAATGGFNVEAEMLDLRDNKVQLKKKDGTEIWVELEKLSLADIRYVEETMKKARQGLRQNMKETSKEETSKEDVPSNNDDGETEGSSRLPGWEVDSDGGSTKSPFAGMKEVNLVLAGSSHDVTFPSVPSLWVGTSRHAGTTRQFQVANIRTGKLLDPVAVDATAQKFALSPDGSSFAVVGGFPSKIAIYSTSNGKKLKDIPSAENSLMNKVFYTSPQQLVVVESGLRHNISLFDIKSGKVTKTIEMDHSATGEIALSPNGKLLAFGGSQGVIHLVDLKQGKRKPDLAIAPKEGSYFHVADLSFCRDGNELAVLGSGTTTEMQVFSMKTGRVVAKHILSESLHSLCPNYSGYQGPAVESYAGNKGWILYGRAIIDRDKGGPIWLAEKPKNGSLSDSVFRVMIDDTRQLALVGNFQSQRFEISELPLSEISKSKEMVVKGGTVEDAGLPEARPVNASSSKLVDVDPNLDLYQGQKKATASKSPAKTVSINSELGLFNQVLFARDEDNTCVAISLQPSNSKKSAAVISLDSGKVGKVIDVSFVSRIHCISQDGKWIAATTGKQNDRVDLFDLKSGKHAYGFRPGKSTDTLNSIQSVRFLGEDRLVTVTSRNEAVVWEVPSGDPVYRFPTFGTVFPFPSGDRFVHFSQGGWMVRQSSNGKPLGRLDSKSLNGNEFPTHIIIRDDETACAALVGVNDQQRIIVWDLQSGKRSHEVAITRVSSAIALSSANTGKSVPIRDIVTSRYEPRATPVVEGIDWCDDETLMLHWNRSDQSRFANSKSISPNVISLLSLKERRLLWDYRLPLGIALQGVPEGQLWFCEFATGASRLVGRDMPSKVAQERIAQAGPPKRVLKADDSIMIDLLVRISGDKLADGLLADQLLAAMEPSLKEGKVTTSERAGLKLSVRAVSFSDRGNRSNIPDLLLSCKLTNISDEILWQQEQLFTGVPSNDVKADLVENARKKQWQSALEWLKETVDPNTIYENWYYRGVGESLLSQNDEKVIEIYSGKTK